MIEPLVSCVMLANGRQEMVVRAVKSFESQTYERKEIVWFDNNGERSIGKLRNEANNRASGDIICHWDSDDWSHANRIAEQVTLLQSSGAECVGYDEMIFWQERKSEAWLYRAANNPNIQNYAIGTSMCYWRSTWERFPFRDDNHSPGCDDWEWSCGSEKRGLSAVKIISQGSLVTSQSERAVADMAPRMIAGIHGGNTCASINPDGVEWKRVPEWDEFCKREMQL